MDRPPLPATVHPQAATRRRRPCRIHRVPFVDVSYGMPPPLESR